MFCYTNNGSRLHYAISTFYFERCCKKESFLQKRWFNLAKEIFYCTLKDILDTGAH